MIEDNAMNTATEMQEDDNGGAVEIQNNGDVRQSRRWRRAADNRGGGYAGR